MEKIGLTPQYFMIGEARHCLHNAARFVGLWYSSGLGESLGWPEPTARFALRPCRYIGEDLSFSCVYGQVEASLGHPLELKGNAPKAKSMPCAIWTRLAVVVPAAA